MRQQTHSIDLKNFARVITHFIIHYRLELRTEVISNPYRSIDDKLRDILFH